MNIKGLKLIFFGTPDLAATALKALIDNSYNITAVFTAKDKEIGRKKVLTESPVKKVAKEHNIPAYQPKTLKDDEVFEEYKKLHPDICVIAAYNKIIPQRYIDVPKYGMVNIHPSLLPKYRGPSPIRSAILNGDNETGVAIMLIDADMDHGPVLAMDKYQIPKDSYYTGITNDLAEIGARLLVKTIPDYIEGKIKPQEQNHSQATICKMIKREDGKINWTKSAKEVYNQIRAMNPEPGTWTLWNNTANTDNTSTDNTRGALVQGRPLYMRGPGEQTKILNIKKAKIYDQQPNHDHSSEYIGVIYEESGRIFIPCSVGHIELEKIQLEGKKETTAKDFLNGHPDFIGSQLE